MPTTKISALNNCESSKNIMQNNTTEGMQHHAGNKNNIAKAKAKNKIKKTALTKLSSRKVVVSWNVSSSTYHNCKS